MIRLFTSLLVVLLCVRCSTEPSHTIQPASTGYEPYLFVAGLNPSGGNDVLDLAGWRQYCRETSDCFKGQPIFFSGPLIELAWANNYVRDQVRYMEDIQDEWFDALAVGYGDCEDWAIAIRYLLVQLGWPRQNLLILAMKTITGGAHALLAVYTDNTWWIVGNGLMEPIRPNQLRGFRNILIEPTEEGFTWQSFNQ